MKVKQTPWICPWVKEMEIFVSNLTDCKSQLGMKNRVLFYWDEDNVITAVCSACALVFAWPSANYTQVRVKLHYNLFL